jgi:hypothetical protein
MADTETHGHASGSIQTPTDRRERLRFTDFQFRRTPDGRCTAEVELEWIDGVLLRGTSAGQSSPTVDLRVAAEATLRAIEHFSDNVLRLELIGVKAIRAFDATVIVVAVDTRGQQNSRLLGASLVESDPVRGAVIAVLQATNRVLGNVIATR